MPAGKLIDARTNDALWFFITSPLYTTAVNLEMPLMSLGGQPDQNVAAP